MYKWNRWSGSNNPCYGCGERSSECHGSCGAYKEFEASQRELCEERLKEQRARNDSFAMDATKLKRLTNWGIKPKEH